MVRRRRAGRFGGDLGIIPLQPGFSPETPIIRISGKVGLLSATQSCTFWWQKLFLRIPPCTFFRKKSQLSDGCLACFRRPNAGNGAPNRGFASKPAPFLALLVRRPPTAPPSSRNPCCRVSPLLAVPRKFRTGVFSAFRLQRRKSGRGSARPERACEKARSFVSVQRGAVAAPVKTVCGWFWVPFATKRYQYIFSAKGSRKHSTLS